MKQPTFLALIASAFLAVAAVSYFGATHGSRPDPAVVEEFKAAHQAAANGDLEGAIADYQALLDEGCRTAAVYYNLASAQHRADNLGPAILNYERAALLEPGATDIAANLARARKDAAVPEEEPNGWYAFLHSAAPNAWSIVAAVSLLGLATLAAVSAFRRGAIPPKVLVAGTACALLAIGLSITALVTWAQETAERGIVVKAGTPLRVSPFPGARPAATLPAGRTVFFSPQDPHQGYRLARLGTGQSGWLDPDEAKRLTDL